VQKQTPRNPLVRSRWLAWQCRLLHDVRFAAVVEVADLSSGEGISADRVAASIGSQKGAFILSNDPSEHHLETRAGVSYWQVPVEGSDHQLMVVMQIHSLSEPERAAADRLLRWGVQNLTDWLTDANVGAAPAMPPLRLMLAQSSLQQAAARWVDDLQFRTQAVRVSVAWFNSERLGLLAVSGVAALDIRRALPRSLTAAMSECARAAEIMTFPPESKDSALSASSESLREHKHLHESFGEHSIISVPLLHNGTAAGVLLLEIDKARGADLSPNELLDEVAMASPVLATLNERRPGTRWFITRLFQKITNVIARPVTTVQRIVSLGVVALGLIALLFPFPHKVGVSGEIQGADRQVLAATHSGYLKSASARAGDQVKAGQVLALFDNSQLQLERDTWVSELSRLDSAIVQAMSARDRAKVGKLRAEQESANAELKLIDHRLERTEIVAPFDGMLVSGDLDDRLGSSVEAGETLFHMASLNDYTLQLKVPEHQASRVHQYSKGTMRFAAFPSKTFSFNVESMVPVAVSTEGGNVFRMQAALKGDVSEIRPGMTGVAKVDVGKRSWLFRGFDLVSDRLRYWWWSIGA